MRVHFFPLLGAIAVLIRKIGLDQQKWFHCSAAIETFQDTSHSFPSLEQKTKENFYWRERQSLHHNEIQKLGLYVLNTVHLWAPAGNAVLLSAPYQGAYQSRMQPTFAKKPKAERGLSKSGSQIVLKGTGILFQSAQVSLGQVNIREKSGLFISDFIRNCK